MYSRVNVVYKSPPYLPQTDYFDWELSFSEKDMQYLQEWGLNVIRLGAMWPGLVPTEGAYSQDYLDRLKWIVDTAGKYGIYTFFDAHQVHF